MLILRLLVIFYINLVLGEDAFYNINTKNALHTVSDKFLSISVDPGVLLAGVNLSETSLLLARHLSPAYIRLAGPSTPYVKYVEDEEDIISHNFTDIVITPSMWFGINEWFNLAKLTPVFGIDDGPTVKGVWDPTAVMDLLEISDKFDVKCYWQLGYDCSNKTTVQYVDDLNVLKQTLKKFPDKEDTWKIAGSDLSNCAFDEDTNGNLENYLNDLEQNVDAVMWESSLVTKDDLGFVKTALWTTVPKDLQPVTFSSAMEWMKQVGKASRAGYDVVFREARVSETTTSSPVYWATYIHKKLMGPILLEVLPIKDNENLHVSVHCSRNQNAYPRSGAITVFVLNDGPVVETAHVRVPSITSERSMEIQEYLLTVSNQNPAQVLLNGEMLTMNRLKSPHDDILKPKLRRTKVRPYISLEVPSNTIAFFVLTGARCSLCSEGKEELDIILEEISEDQEESFSGDDVSFNIEQRMLNNRHGDALEKFHGKKITLEGIKKSMLDEMEQDQKYYEKMTRKDSNRKNMIQEDRLKNKLMISGDKKDLLHEHLKAFIGKARKGNIDKSGYETKPDYRSPDFRVPSNSLFLTIKEVEEIIKRRAKEKAAKKNIKLTSSELDMLVDKATIHIPNHIVGKRDINHVLLEEKANFYKNNQFSQERFEKFARNQKSPPKFKLMKRDINLDMLKKKIKSEGSWGKSQPVTQPEFLRKYWDEPEDTFRMKDHYNDELFKNSMDSDELTMENLGVEEDMFPNFATSDEDWYYKNQFQPKQKHKPQKLNLDMDRRWMPISIRNRNGPNKFSEVYREEIDSGKVKKLKLPWFESSKKNKYPWEDTYGYNGQKNRDMSVFNGLDELNFYDDLDYAFARKRRALLNTIAKAGPMKFKKNEIKKLGKHKIQKNKVPCKNCLKEKKQKSNIQVLLKDKHDKRNKTLDDLIAEADINENTIPPPRSKRSLLNNELPFLFGQYKPLTLDLKPWQPVDVLTLVKDHPSLLPLYALIQEQNLKNSLMHPRYFGLRRKRFIDQKRLDSFENSIALKTKSREDATEEKIEWNKNNGVTEKNDDGKGNAEWEIVSGDLKKENVNNVEQQTANKRITKFSNLDNEPDVNQNILQKNIDKKITNLGEENTEMDEKTTEDISEIKKVLLDDIRRKLEERYNVRHFISERKDDKYDQDGELLKSRHNIEEVNNEDQIVRRNKYLESNNDLYGTKENSIFKEKYENTNADPLNILQKVVRKNILKAARENLIEKEKSLESQMNDLEATRQTTLNAIKNGALRRNDVNNKDNIVSRIPTFLEKVLGQSNAKPIENLMETVKKSIKQMNVNLNNFITRLF